MKRLIGPLDPGGGRRLALDAGGGGDALFVVAGTEPTAYPWVWMNGGTTLAVSQRTILDAGVSVVLPLTTDSDDALFVLPNLRLRLSL